MRLINIDKPIAQLNNLSLREVFEGGQLVVNGDFDNGTTSWTQVNTTGFTVNNGIAQFTVTSQFGRIQVSNNTLSLYGNQNDKMYVASRLKTSVTGNSQVTFSVNDGVSETNIFYTTSMNGFNLLSNIRTIASNATLFSPRIYDNRSSNFTQIEVDYIYAINLTALGINLTKEQMDEYFAMYQSGVEASGFVQKTSKNLFNKSREVLEIGTISADTGLDVAFSSRARNVGFMDILPSQQYALQVPTNYQINRVFYYTSANAYISNTIVDNRVGLFTTPSNASKLRYALRNDANTNLNTNDLTVLSNGLQLELGTVATTYQPYRPFALAKGIDEVAYGGKTYREIFEGGQLLANSDFTDGTTGWNFAGSTISSIDNQYVQVSSTTNFGYVGRLNQKIIGQIYYQVSSAKKISGTMTYFDFGTDSTNIIVPTNDFQQFSARYTATETIVLTRGRGTPNYIYQVDYIYLYNLTQLFGAGNEPDKATMDKLFQQYQEGGTVQAQAFIQTAGKDTRVIDAKLPYLNMMSIREVFESNLVVNGDFSSSTGWTISNASGTISNGLATFTATNQFGSIQQNITSIIGNTYYVATELQASSSTVRLYHEMLSPATTSHSGNGQYQIVSIKSNALSNPNNEIRIIDFASSGFTQWQSKGIYVLNLTALNLTHLTQAELDAMFALYQAGTLKLSDVFETGNLVTNGDFSDGLNDWSVIEGSIVEENGFAKINVEVPTNFRQLGLNVIGNNNYFLTHDGFSTDLGGLAFSLRNSSNVNLTSNQTQIYTSSLTRYSHILTTNGNGSELVIVRPATNRTGFVYIDNIYLTNLNTHNLQATTKTFMDDLFKAYNRYKSPLFIDKDGIAYGVVFVSKGD
jgi:hypothetical protein